MRTAYRENANNVYFGLEKYNHVRGHLRIMKYAQKKENEGEVSSVQPRLSHHARMVCAAKMQYTHQENTSKG